MRRQLVAALALSRRARRISPAGCPTPDDPSSQISLPTMKSHLPLVSTIALGAVLLFVGGCSSSLRVASDFDEHADFSSYTTYDWVVPPSGVGEPLAGYPTLAVTIKRAIEDDLAAKGYQKVDEAPDFYVTYHAAAEQRLTPATFDRWGYRRPGRPGGGRPPSTYDVGTLVIDIVDSGTNELVWRGSATDVVSVGLDRVQEQAREAVGDVLALFPPPTSTP
ncbi:MAG: DUF4136 domain-containing protein [Sandaracinaceae bacterium]